MNLWFKLFITSLEGQEYAQTQILQGTVGPLKPLIIRRLSHCNTTFPISYLHLS